VTDTPPPGDDDLLGSAAPAPQARQHRSHRSRHRRRGLRPIDIAGIVVAVLVVVGVVVVIAKSHKSSSTTTATTTTAAPAKGKTTTTAAAQGANATVWTFTGLDGKSITVGKGTSGSARFVVYKGNAVPVTVAAIDKAMAKNDCAAVQKIYDADKSPNPSSTAKSNDRRSAFAHYALVQATAKNCAWAKANPPQ